MVIANFAALLNDDGVWDNPERFWPERFIGCDGKLIVPDEYLPFGYGNKSIVYYLCIFIYSVMVFFRLTLVCFTRFVCIIVFVPFEMVKLGTYYVFVRNQMIWMKYFLKLFKTLY